jgi:hypothetical protein
MGTIGSDRLYAGYARARRAIPHPRLQRPTDREAFVIALLLLGFAGISLPRLGERLRGGLPPFSGRPKKSEKKPGGFDRDQNAEPGMVL